MYDLYICGRLLYISVYIGNEPVRVCKFMLPMFIHSDIFMILYVYKYTCIYKYISIHVCM